VSIASQDKKETMEGVNATGVDDGARTDVRSKMLI
jgi:hypothetical protein